MSAQAASARRSCLAVGVDERRGNRFPRRLAAPQDKLEHGVEALAFLDRRLGQGFGLLEAQPLAFARIEDRGMAEHDQPRPRPHLEMADPQLLVDQAQRFEDRRTLFGADLDVGKSEELQHLVFRAPHAAQLVLRPAARRRGHDLALGGALARPAAGLEICFKNLDRSAVVALVLDFFLAQDHAPALLRGVPPPRLAVPAAGPATFASSAAIRAFKITFSSRAAAAMAFTASNSSRPTKSCPPIHSRIFSRAENSASRPMPAKVPAKPFTILTKSSNTLFSDCIEESPFRRGNRDLGALSPPRPRDYPQLAETIPNYQMPSSEVPAPGFSASIAAFSVAANTSQPRYGTSSSPAARLSRRNCPAAAPASAAMAKITTFARTMS